jgi:molybdopterin-guanine dinucleotide biosynthesis protein B
MRRDAPRRPPLVLALAGPSGAGKTTLAEHLVRTWSGVGLRVGYVKHASHGFQMDRPGKDSARLSASGAAGVAVTGPEGTAFLEPVGPSTADRLVRRFFPDADVVVVEGFREEALPTVLIVGDASPIEIPGDDSGRVLAGYGPSGRRAALEELLGDRPVFERSQLGGLVEYLDRWRAGETKSASSTRARSGRATLPSGARVA